MKTILVLFFAGGLFLSGEAQFLPSFSPEGEITQRVGFTTFTVRYGRPAVRGRTVMGGLVRYGHLWRTGAGAATVISFDRDVAVAGKRVPAGSYALVTVPGEETWTIMLNCDTSRIYVENKDYDLANEAVRFTADVIPFTYFETFTIIPDIAGHTLRLLLAWENTAIRFDIQTFTDEQVEQKVLTLTAANADHESLGAAAHYYLITGQHPNRALELVDQALKQRKESWYFETRMKLLAAAGLYHEAYRTLEEAVQYLRNAKPDYWEDKVASLQALAAGWKK